MKMQSLCSQWPRFLSQGSHCHQFSSIALHGSLNWQGRRRATSIWKTHQTTANSLAPSQLQESPCGCPKAPQPLRMSWHVFRMSLDTSGVSILTLGAGKAQSWVGRGQKKKELDTQKKLQNEGGSPEAKPQGLCNSCALGADTLPLPLPFLQQLDPANLGLQL